MVSLTMICIWLQSFWPSIVMKKWLNIQPKVYDFSEDEVDTETESEDDCMSCTNYSYKLALIDYYSFPIVLHQNFCLCLKLFFFCILFTAYSLKDERKHQDHARKTQGNQSVCQSQDSGNIQFFFSNLIYQMEFWLYFFNETTISRGNVYWEILTSLLFLKRVEFCIRTTIK